jgi:hypothetical protein
MDWLWSWYKKPNTLVWPETIPASWQYLLGREMRYYQPHTNTSLVRTKVVPYQACTNLNIRYHDFQKAPMTNNLLHTSWKPAFDPNTITKLVEKFEKRTNTNTKLVGNFQKKIQYQYQLVCYYLPRTLVYVHCNTVLILKKHKCIHKESNVEQGNLRRKQI